MRWKDNTPDLGDRREREGFLWWPKKIGRETRWLERARWQEYGAMRFPKNVWEAIEWLPLCAQCSDTGEVRRDPVPDVCYTCSVMRANPDAYLGMPRYWTAWDLSGAHKAPPEKAEPKRNGKKR